MRAPLYLVLLAAALLVVLQDVVPDVVLGVDQQLLGLPLLVAPLHPHHEQQHQDYGRGRETPTDKRGRGGREGGKQ